jgi:hypothetical protein
MTLYQEANKVCLYLGTEKRQTLFSVEIAKLAYEHLFEFATKAAINKKQLSNNHEPTISVDLIINNRIPQIRLRFSWWSEKIYINPIHAINLAKLIQAGVIRAEKELKWIEERDPGILIK